MKRFLAAILALLLLTGCASQIPEEKLDPLQTAPTAAQPAAKELYAPDSAIEQLTDGAVRAYPLEKRCLGMKQMGDGLLLFFEVGEQTELVLCSGTDCAVTAETTIPFAVTPESPLLQTNENGLAYIDETENALVLMDSRLRPITRVTLPEDMDGTPVLSPRLNSIFYCAGGNIRAFDLEQGQSRLLKSHQVQSQTLLGCRFDGQVLMCSITDTSGNTYTAFLSTENGETLGKSAALEDFQTYGDAYLLRRGEGIVKETLFGTLEEPYMALNAAYDGEEVYSVLAQGCALAVKTEAGGTTLSAFDLTSGKKVSVLTLADMGSLRGYFANSLGVWFLSDDSLYLWDMEKSRVDDDTVYTAPHYTGDAPDEDGLAELQAQADQLGEKYGVDIRVWRSAAEITGGYAIETEFQTVAIQKGLAALDVALTCYPDGFFQTLAGATAGGKLHISLVRSVDEGAPGVQFWEGGDAYIALAIGDTLESALFHEVNHVVDTYVLAGSRAYDDWDSLNPQGFDYDYSYELYETRTDTTYLDGEARAFISSYSMTYPTEDRATIMEYAMTEGNAAYFAATAMQSKLLRMCEAIREAFHWEDNSETFPWEQYLAEPIA